MENDDYTMQLTQIKKVMEADGKVRRYVYDQAMTPDEFNDTEWIEMVHDCLEHPEEFLTEDDLDE